MKCASCWRNQILLTEIITLSAGISMVISSEGQDRSWACPVLPTAFQYFQPLAITLNFQKDGPERLCFGLFLLRY